MSRVRGASRGRLGRHRILSRFVGLFSGFILLSAVVGALVGPNVHAACQPYKPCGPPSKSASGGLRVWRSTRYGFTLDVPSAFVTIANQTPDRLELALNDSSGLLVIQGTPASQGTPAAAVQSTVSALSGKFNGLTRDTRAQEQILGANVGGRTASWGAFTGTFEGPIAPNQPTTMAIQSASNGRVVITATALDFSNKSYRSVAYAAADLIFNSIQWAS